MSNVIFSRPQFTASSYGIVRVLAAGVVLALVLLGAHVCPPAGSTASGIQVSISAASPTCPVCALGHTLILTLLLILLSLVSNYSGSSLVSQPVRSFLHGLRMDLRAPPVL